MTPVHPSHRVCQLHHLTLAEEVEEGEVEEGEEEEEEVGVGNHSRPTDLTRHFITRLSLGTGSVKTICVV